MTKPRRRFSAEEKAQVALEATKGSAATEMEKVMRSITNAWS